MHHFKLVVSVAFALIFSTAGPVYGASVMLTASDSGWHSSGGNHTFSNENYTVGWSNEEFRNFFVFDLSSVSSMGTIISAVLRAYNPAVSEPDVTYTGGYASPDSTETWEIHEVLAPSSLVTAPTIANTTVYDDLGDGAVFGSAVASAANNGSIIDVVLNTAAIDHLQAYSLLGIDVVLGGVLSSLTSDFGTEESLFAHTDPPNGNQGSPYARQLILTFESASVPEIDGSQLGISLTLLLSLVLLYRERDGFQSLTLAHKKAVS